MNNEWSLKVLYEGTEDPKLAEDLQKLLPAIQKMETLAKDKDTSVQNIHDCISALEEYMNLVMKIMNFLSLKQSANTSDEKVASLLGQAMQLMSESTVAETLIKKKIAAVSDLESYIQKDSLLKEYEYALREIQGNSKYQLSEEVEDVIAKMNLSAGSSWGRLQEYLTSNVEVDYQGEKLNLPQIRNLAYDEDSAVRKSAYEAELETYPKIADGVCFALNNIKSQVNTICKLRGYQDALDETLHNSRMKKETLDALWAAIREALPDFWKYLRRKGEMLGYSNGLPWYELFAPIGKDDGKQYTVEDAKNYLISHFEPFAPDLAAMIKEAFDHEWIDFYPRQGKVGGAFCANLPMEKQSRILTNFTGVFGDIVTLAHELGHAYHGKQIEEHRVLNQDYTMPVAETASTFNETVIMNAAIDEAEGEVRLKLLESQLQDVTQIICDIYSRYLFESEVFKRRESEFLFPATLNEIMLNAQRTAYGDGLDPDCLHPYMWVCKSHYYSEGLSFYNFPYAFGGLFARGLYAKYLKDGEAFLPQYRELLRATTVKNTEDVAQMAGIDLTDINFWREALNTVRERIHEFMELTEK